MESLMNQPLVLLGAGAFVIFIIMLLFQAGLSLTPYIPKKALLTKAELNFYHHLIEAVQHRANILCCVRLADLVDIRPSIKSKRRREVLGKIAQKHIDFVLVDDHMNILCAIELNDRSHLQPDRKERDKFVRKVLEQTKIPLLEIKASRNYSTHYLRRGIEEIVPDWSTPTDDISPSQKSHIIDPVESIKPIPVKADTPPIAPGDIIEDSLLDLTSPEISTQEVVILHTEEREGLSAFEAAKAKADEYCEEKRTSFSNSPSLLEQSPPSNQDDPKPLNQSSIATCDMRLDKDR